MHMLELPGLWSRRSFRMVLGRQIMSNDETLVSCNRHITVQ